MAEKSSNGTHSSRAVTWQRTRDDFSIEQAQVNLRPDGLRIAGIVLSAHKGIPLRVDYRLDCDAQGRTGRVKICQWFSGVYSKLCLERDPNGQWRRNGQIDLTLAACTDIDLGITPSTNTLPIRRLKLAVGTAKEVTAAWVSFPELTVCMTRQSYERASAGEYIYRNIGSGFTAPIKVDAEDIVQDYRGVWTRIADGPPAAEVGAFSDALVSDAPSPELTHLADEFGWLVGGWSGEVRDFDSSGQTRSGTGEWWFSWVLEGRAIQDVWIVPRRTERSASGGNMKLPDAPYDRYGTTVRCFDRESTQWKIVWVNPVSGVVNRLAGKREGDRISLEGEHDGHPILWTFNDIRQDSFVWRGESRQHDGTWKLDAEFWLKRIA